MADAVNKLDTVSINQQTKDISSGVISFFIFFFISVLLIITSGAFLHWFIIPVTLTGVIIGSDAVNWLRRRMDVFDPVGILGLFGIHFFYIAPVLHILWNHQLVYLPPLADWRPWLGHMAVLNLFGLLLYRVFRAVFKSHSQKSTVSWQLDYRLLHIVLFFALGITASLQILVYQQYGGVLGYIGAFEEVISGRANAFVGLGSLFAISESFPLVVMIGFAAIAHRRDEWKSWIYIFAMLFLFFVIRIFFGGLRGSRSNTLFAMVWALGIVHLYIRPVPRKFILVGLILMIIFMYVFGFFKNAGLDAFNILRDPSSISLLESETHRTLETILLSDMGRADMQAYLLERLYALQSDYQYGYGITYLGGLLTPIPNVLWSNELPTKVQYGTEALYGRGAYLSGRVSSRVFGLAGEAVLNFGPLSVPFAFIILGLLVGLVRKWLLTWEASDVRRLLLPFMILLCLLVLTSDSDNNSVFLVKQGLVPLIVVWLSSKKILHTNP